MPAKKLAVFTSQPRWSRLQHLHVTHANELDTLASRGWITHGDLPAEGRYLAVAIPLLTRTNGRPALKAAWVAAVGVES